jgi:hypothetical protein
VDRAGLWATEAISESIFIVSLREQTIGRHYSWCAHQTMIRPLLLLTIPAITRSLILIPSRGPWTLPSMRANLALDPCEALCCCSLTRLSRRTSFISKRSLPKIHPISRDSVAPMAYLPAQEAGKGSAMDMITCVTLYWENAFKVAAAAGGPTPQFEEGEELFVNL